MRRDALDEARRWFEQATEDLKWATLLTKEGGFHIACFLAQQVAEKAVKAFLYSQGESPVLGHSVAALVQRAGEFNETIAGRATSWAILDGYYIPTRYPNGLPDSIPARVYNREAAEQAVKLAKDAVDIIGHILGL